MANKQLVFENVARDLGTGQFFALKLIDGGSAYTMYLEELTQPPKQPAVAAQITATGVPIIAPSGAGDVIGLGTTNTLPLWTDGPNSVIGDSLLTQSGGNIVQTSGQFVFSGQARLDNSAAGNANASLQLSKSFAPTSPFASVLFDITSTLAQTIERTLSSNLTLSHASGTIGEGSGITISTLALGAGTVTALNGLTAGVVSAGGSNPIVTKGIGISGSIGAFTSGTMTTAVGVQALARVVAAATITTANIIESAFTYTSGTITAIRGLFIGGWTGNPPATNLDGILIDTTIDAAAAATKFAFRSLSVSPSFFSGTIQAATGVDLGALATPFRDLYLFGSGTYGTTSLKLTGTPTGARVVTFPDVSITVARSDAAQTLTGNQTINGNVILNTAGNGLSVKEGSNATMGTGILNGTTEVTISTTKVTANSNIFLSIQAPGGTPLGVIYVSSRSPNVSFGVKGAATDTSTFAWWIVEPA